MSLLNIYIVRRRHPYIVYRLSDIPNTKLLSIYFHVWVLVDGGLIPIFMNAVDYLELELSDIHRFEW